MTYDFFRIKKSISVQMGYAQNNNTSTEFLLERSEGLMHKHEVCVWVFPTGYNIIFDLWKSNRWIDIRMPDFKFILTSHRGLRLFSNAIKYSLLSIEIFFSKTTSLFQKKLHSYALNVLVSIIMEFNRISCTTLTVLHCNII